MNKIKIVAILKNFLARSYGYLLVATFGLSLYNIIPDPKYFIPAFILGIGIMLGLGWVDWKFGFYKAETSHMAKQNLPLMEIQTNIREILEWIKQQ